MIDVDWSPSIPLVIAAVVAVSTWLGATFARRRERAETASILTDTAMSLLVPLNASIATLQGDVRALQSQVAALSEANRNLQTDNTLLRQRVAALERQLVALGHTPVTGAPLTPHVVTTSTTEVVTVTEGEVT